jgi:hypothetical protein
MKKSIKTSAKVTVKPFTVKETTQLGKGSNAGKKVFILLTDKWISNFVEVKNAFRNAGISNYNADTEEGFNYFVTPCDKVTERELISIYNEVVEFGEKPVKESKPKKATKQNEIELLKEQLALLTELIKKGK